MKPKTCKNDNPYTIKYKQQKNNDEESSLYSK